MDNTSNMETLIIRISPAWKRELEKIKAQKLAAGSVISLSEIVRQKLAPWMEELINGVEIKDQNGNVVCARSGS